MLLTMKALALIADGRREEAREIMVDVIAQEPESQRRLVMALFFFTDDQAVFSQEMRDVVQAIPAQQVHNLVLAAFHLFAQPFQQESARSNIFGPGTQLLLDLHGREAVPEAVRASLPARFGHL
jgi:hypothetical protein